MSTLHGLRHRVRTTALVVAMCPSIATAHIALDSPEVRSGGIGEVAPCAGGNGNVSGSPTQFQAGETITVQWNEAVDHDATYRISLAPSEDDLATESGNVTVLASDVPDNPEGTYSVEVTLPDAPCEACVLQVIQLAGFQDYYQCADIVISGEAGEPAPGGGLEGEPTGAGGSGGAPSIDSPSAGSGGSSGAASAPAMGGGPPADVGSEVDEPATPPVAPEPAPDTPSSEQPPSGEIAAPAGMSSSGAASGAVPPPAPPPVAAPSPVPAASPSASATASGTNAATTPAPAAAPAGTGPAADSDASAEGCSTSGARAPASLPTWGWLGACALALVRGARRGARNTSRSAL